MSPSTIDLAAHKTIARLVWSVQAEGLGDIQSSSDVTLDAVLHAARIAIESSCLQRGLDFSSESWMQLVKEIHQSAENETHGLAWREAIWRPRMRERVGVHGSLWSWFGGLDAASEEAQLAWEVCAAFDGHLTHPCAKTKLPMSLNELEATSAEFSPTVPLVVGALASRAARSFVSRSCGVAAASRAWRLRRAA